MPSSAITCATPSQSRVSRIEAGDITHAEMGTLSAHVHALGGVVRVTADFGDELLGGPLPGEETPVRGTSRG